MTFGSLFAGIGGMDLGLERAGMTCKWQVEIDPFCQKVLAKHWPEVKRYGDITKLDGSELEGVDLICGGFPCQDISLAGKGAGINGQRSGLWAEYARIIRELRPRFVFVENVSALLGRGLERVLGDLAASGYDAEWDCISACDFGAPHIRERLWLVAHANGSGCCQSDIFGQQQRGTEVVSASETGSNSDSSGLSKPRNPREIGQSAPRIFQGAAVTRDSWWAIEPDVGRVAYGVPARVDRLKGLGNAVVPQVAEWIGRRIMEAARNGRVELCPARPTGQESY